MAKKARKAAAKRGKAPKAKKSTARAAKKTKKKTRKTSKRKAKPTIRERISSGYHAVIDTVAGTQALRKKWEKPGTDESE